MIYDWREDSFEELPFLEWKLVASNVYQTVITKNGRKYKAQLQCLSSSWKLKLVEEVTDRIILELRFRDVGQDDAMSKAEYYILEYIT